MRRYGGHPFACEACGAPFVSRLARGPRFKGCSEVCRGRLRRGNPRPDLRPKCWCWDAIRTLLAEGPASTGELAQAVYGSDAERDRRAVICILYQLAGTRYRGGPWIVRVHHGHYALPGARVATPAAVLTAIRRQPLTIDDLAARFGIAPRTVLDWLQAARRRGVPVEHRMPPPNRRQGRLHWFFVGRTARGRATAFKGERAA